MCFRFTKTFWPGVSPGPPDDMSIGTECPGSAAVPKRARSAGAASADRLHTRALAATASRSAVESDAATRFHGLIIRREDVEHLGRKPETGGTPTPLGVEFVRYRRSHGPGFRQTVPKTPRMAVRAVFRARQGHGPRMATTQ